MGTKFRLSVMMFLEFFVWGAWYVTVANYMGQLGMAKYVYWAFTVGPIGAIVSPFFLGMVADRFFPTERVLGVMHIIGGIAMFCAPFVVASPVAFIGMLLLHMLCYQPTLGLANTLAFHHIRSQEKEFPLIRAFGTVGWIVAGVLVSGILSADKTAIPLHVAGAAGILMGLYSFTLPHTPPPAAGRRTSFREIAGIDAISRLSSRSFNIFILSSLLICIPLAAYYSYAQMFVANAGLFKPVFAKPGFSLSFGQMSEAVFIVCLPFFFRTLKVKWTLFVGMLAWVLRYVLFALGAPDTVVWMIYAGILLHGICYDFFFVTGQIYVDKKASVDIRGQAQGFIILVTYGVGMLIGAQVTGWIFNATVTETGSAALPQWQSFWWIPAAFAAAVLVIFGLLFRDDSQTLVKKEGGRS
jgi:nucleoside transporter